LLELIRLTFFERPIVTSYNNSRYDLLRSSGREVRVSVCVCGASAKQYEKDSVGFQEEDWKSCILLTVVTLVK